MVLTEFNEEVYKKGIYDEGYSKGKDDGISEGIAQGISQGIAQGISQGISQGITQGITQGQSALADAIKRLRSGATVEDLINEGIDKDTADLAWNCMRN